MGGGETVVGRETFSSGWGMAMAMLGVAIGLGNFWRFPYMMGIFGGSAFLLVYLAAVVLFALPAMMAEMGLGRHARNGPVGAFVEASPRLGRPAGYALWIGVAMAMSYYLTILGWILAFLLMSIAVLVGLIAPTTFSFMALEDSWPAQVLCSSAVAVATALVVARGIRRGIERISRVCVPAFTVLTLALLIRSVTLPGASEGLSYLLTPEWSAMTPQAFLAAVGQAFFSLGLGGTFLVIYGSYLKSEVSIPHRALTTCAGDVVASLLAAFTVMPMVFAFGLSPASGPQLLFEVLPQVFRSMPGGQVLAVVFFAGLGSVAFLSGVAAVEVLVGSLVDGKGIRRKRGAWWVVAALVVLGIPATLSIDYIMFSDLFWGSTMQPAGSAVALFAFAWGLDRSVSICQLAKDGKVPAWAGSWYLWVRYVVPLAIVVALLWGWVAS